MFGQAGSHYQPKNVARRYPTTTTKTGMPTIAMISIPVRLPAPNGDMSPQNGHRDQLLPIILPHVGHGAIREWPRCRRCLRLLVELFEPDPRSRESRSGPSSACAILSLPWWMREALPTG